MSVYSASAIEVLSGLDPVRKRPGMYTDTTRPNHMVQEILDNSVDEALGGFADEVRVVLHADGLIEISDNGRGMPVDIHPEHGVSGIELILTRLHAGGKFSGKNYKYSGGLHGVGASVVNALSTHLEVEVKRNGQLWRMTFADGYKRDDLQIVGDCAKRATGTVVRFRPDPKYFDSPKAQACVACKSRALPRPTFAFLRCRQRRAPRMALSRWPKGLSGRGHRRLGASARGAIFRPV